MNQTTKLDRLFTWFSATYPGWEFQLQYKPNGIKLRVWKNTSTEQVENIKTLTSAKNSDLDIEVIVKDTVANMISEVI